MKKLLTLSLLLVSLYSFANNGDTTITRYNNVDLVVIDPAGNPNPPSNCDHCLGINPIVVDPVTGVMTITYSNGTKYVSPPLKGKDGYSPKILVGTTTTLPAGSQATVTDSDPGPDAVFNFGIPKGLDGTNTGGGSATNAKEYNVLNYGATGNGSTDDRAAIQRAIDDAIANQGKLVIPPANNYYRINNTLNIGGPGYPTQIWIDVLAWGSRRGFGIVYHGPSNQPAIKIIGAKNGIYQGLQVKVADGISGVDVISIGTWGQANSTAGLTFIGCNLEVNDGAHNKGFVLGKIQSNPGVDGNDISQITFISCAVWGRQTQASFPAANGQIGYYNAGNNTLQITWVGGGFTFIDRAVFVEKAGAVYFYGMGTSHVNTVFDLTWANLFTINGGRFEFGQKFIKVNSGGMPIVTVQGAPQTEDFKPSDGRFIEFNAAGHLILDGLKINRTDGVSFDSRAITLGGNGGALFMTGGGVKAMSGEFFNATSGWKLNIQDVARIDAGHNIAGYFTNRRTP